MQPSQLCALNVSECMDCRSLLQAKEACCTNLPQINSNQLTSVIVIMNMNCHEEVTCSKP